MLTDTPIAHSSPVRLRGGPTGSLVRALWAISALAVLLGVIQIGVGLAHSELLWAVLCFTAAFWVWTLAGVLAWWRRPSNGTGPLIIVGAIALLLGGLGNLDVPFLDRIQTIFATAALAVAVHLLHAFPSGRLRGRISITTVVLAYVVAIVFDLLAVLVPAQYALAHTAISFTQTALGIAVMALTATVLVRRLLTADRAHRRVLLPLFAYGILTVLLIPLAPLILRPFGADPIVTGSIQLALLAGLPVAFLLGVLRGGFTRTTALEALSAWLAIGGAKRPAVASALASTLGDESLRVVYWAPERSRFVDEHGADIARDEDDPRRGWIEVRVDARLVGAIEYDALMIDDPASVRRAGEVLAIAIDREHLTAELLASNEELLRSRVRLVEAAYRERSRIARDLHDGLQVQLVLLALEAQTIANSPDASAATSAASEQLRRGIDEAAADVRRIVHNVLPATLLEQGLTAAAEDLVDRLEMPATFEAELAEGTLAAATMHTAYFVIAEALANAVKHSRASTVNVHVRQVGDRLRVVVRDDGVGGARVDGGTGLSGLVERVDVLGGTIEIVSDRNEGTEVMVELPCG